MGMWVGSSLAPGWVGLRVPLEGGVSSVFSAKRIFDPKVLFQKCPPPPRAPVPRWVGRCPQTRFPSPPCPGGAAGPAGGDPDVPQQRRGGHLVAGLHHHRDGDGPRAVERAAVHEPLRRPLQHRPGVSRWPVCPGSSAWHDSGPRKLASSQWFIFFLL